MTRSEYPPLEEHETATTPPEDVRYTFEWYESFLRAVADHGFEFRRYRDPVDAGTVLLRHDVDLAPERALRTAEIEAELGVHATYFFLVSSPMYNVLNEATREILGEIAALGHDVGLHFSTHQYWSSSEIPEDAAVAARVEAERELLAVVADPIETVSFHIPPDPVLRREFGSFPSTYEPRFFSEIGYSGDSSQRWREEPPIVENFDERMQILTHPGLWSETDEPFEECVRHGVDRTGTRTSDYAETRYVTQELG